MNSWLRTSVSRAACGGRLSLREDQYLPGPGLPWLQIWYLPLQDRLSTVSSRPPSRWASARSHCRKLQHRWGHSLQAAEGDRDKTSLSVFVFRHIIELFSALEYLYIPGLLPSRGMVS